jgi:lipid-A-disaccharide synthase
MSPRLFLSAGEPSGDLHAANLIRAMQASTPEVSIRGFGGARMVAAGAHCDFDLTTMAVIGFAEVLPKLREFFRLADMAESIFRRGDCDGVVLIDFPGFHWHLAKRAKKHGLPVFYYLPPQLWAWGSWRVRKMKKYVNTVLCNLPFEPAWYAQHGIQADYVGHPFFDIVHSQLLCPDFLAQQRCLNGIPVAVLPGSRDREVHRLWPLQLEIIRRLHPQFPEARFLVATLKEEHATFCRHALRRDDQRLPLDFFVGKTSEILEVAECGLIKSGSVSLEMMARGTPGVVIYHASRSTYAIARLLTQVKSFTLPNLIADEMIVPEYLAIGKSLSAVDQATAAMQRLLGDAAAREQQTQALKELSAKYAQPGASRQAAALILKAMQAQPASQAPAQAA